MPELRTAQDFREAPPRTIVAAGAQFAYRELGPRAGVPLVPVAHLGANLDNRGSAHCDGLAQDRCVITVDYRGVGDSMEAMAADMVAVTGPVLMVHGDSGRTVPPQNATALARHLPTATVTVFPDFGHGVAFHNHRAFVDAAPGLPAPLTPLRTTTHRTP